MEVVGDYEHQRLLDRLNKEADESRMTMRELSRAMGFHEKSLYNLFGGKQPGLEMCRKIAEYLGQPLEYVLFLAGRIDDPTVQPHKPDPEVTALARRIGQAPPEIREKLYKIIEAVLDSEGL